MNKTIALIICFSLVSLVIGILLGYRINPIKVETIEEIDGVTNRLEEINDIKRIDANLLRTKSYVSIFIELLNYLRNNDQASAISIIDSSLRDIHSELTKDLDAESLSDDEMLLIELIDTNLEHNQKTKESKTR